MVKRAVEMEGTVTGEHGVGLVKRDYLAHETNEATVDAMRKACSQAAQTLSNALLIPRLAETSVRSALHLELR